MVQEKNPPLNPVRRITVQGSVVNIFLTLVKLGAGIGGQSSAMIADAVHSLSDFATDLVVLLAVSISQKPRDEDHNYGHGKFETLGTLIIGGSLLAVGLGLIFSAAQSILVVLQGGVLPTPGWIAFGAAVVSVGVKEALFQVTRRVGRRLRNQMLQANAWHHRSDALSSVAAMAGIGGAILLGPSFAILDPLAGLGVSAVICWVAWRILRGCLAELAETSVDPQVRQQILTIVEKVDGVADPHNLRARWVGSELALDIHIRVAGTMTVDAGHVIATEVEQELRQSFGDKTMTNIHVEPSK
ncbi:MAG: cation transporter [Spirochaetales bacterium]|nr:cation transporter [Spirochaetales bacterium]